MKKVRVYKVTQKNMVFYSMVADPRMIAKIRKQYTAGEQQDVQRPWVESKVKDIAAYVGGKAEVEGKNSLGIIPNSPIINLKSGLKVKSETIANETFYYVEFPETDEQNSLSPLLHTSSITSVKELFPLPETPEIHVTHPIGI